MDTNKPTSIKRPKRGAYRQHSIEFKRSVVEQSLHPDASVSLIARAHNINANQLFTWRKLFREGKLGQSADDKCHLLPVTIAALPDSPSLPAGSGDSASVGLVQLEIGKAHLRIEGCVDKAALSLILDRLLP